MSPRASRLAVAAASAVLAMAALTACVPEDAPDPGADSSASASPAPGASSSTRPTPTPSQTAAAQVPADCREMLDDAVLAQLDEVPLNDPAFGESGVQPDGSIVCIWGDPAADTTGLVTTISYLSRGPALDMLNQLADEEGFTCYTPDGGTRCEKSWPNETYPVNDGRTLFWRDDILIDTRYSDLAPSGYTAAIVESVYG